MASAESCSTKAQTQSRPAYSSNPLSFCAQLRRLMKALPGVAGRLGTRGLLARGAGFALLDERLKTQQVLVHGTLHVRAEQLRREMSQRAARRVIGQMHIDARAAIGLGQEADNPFIRNGRARLASPGQQLIGHELNED